MVKFLPLILPQVEHPETRIDMYPHQALMLDEWEGHKTFLLITKTGTGKTIGAVMPLLKKKERAILVYPTTELVRDQVRSIAGWEYGNAYGQRVGVAGRTQDLGLTRDDI
jgi:ATP-dependent helicase YprA (DUF1998 family)